VDIQGLPLGWTAYVAPVSGRIVFHDLTTGRDQLQVPAGFADSAATDAPGVTGTAGVAQRDSRTQGIHLGISCDGCQGAVVGVRYQSMVRGNFDLCETCMLEDQSPDDWIKHEFVPGSDQHILGAANAG